MDDVTPTRFGAAASELGANATPAELDAAATQVLRHWGSAERGYHNLQHLAEVLSALDELGSNTADVELAAWFHDVVYRGRPGQDEQDSAQFAAMMLSALGVPVAPCRRVAELILVTIDHSPSPGDAGAEALCDADLRILASSPQRYAEYTAAVRREYAHVPTAAFNAGRAGLLERLLARTRPNAQRPLFSAQAPPAWTAQAADNLAAEIALLRARVG